MREAACQHFWLANSSTLSHHFSHFPVQPSLFSMFMTEHLEKYVMLKLYRVAFHECVESARERDTWFEKRMQVLRKVLTADHLDVNPSCRSSMTLELASSELEKVNSYRAPVDKAQCVVRCCSFLFNQLSVNRNDKMRVRADDFLPVFIYCTPTKCVAAARRINYVSAYPTHRHSCPRPGIASSICRVRSRSSRT